jgi:hypothetical protein
MLDQVQQTADVVRVVKPWFSVDPTVMVRGEASYKTKPAS